MRGGGIYNTSASPTVTNTILWQNFAEEGSQIHNHQSFPTVTYSDIQGGYPGGGNINVNPLFEHVDVNDFHTNDWDVHLQSDSPCIDTGSNAAPAIPETDYDADSRIMDGDNDGTDTADMGCDEYRPSNIPPPNWCEGDFGGDGDVDEADLAAFAADFGRTNCDLEDTCNGDFDDDSDADGSELATFATDLGRTDCP